MPGGTHRQHVLAKRNSSQGIEHDRRAGAWMVYAEAKRRGKLTTAGANYLQRFMKAAPGLWWIYQDTDGQLYVHIPEIPPDPPAEIPLSEWNRLATTAEKRPGHGAAPIGGRSMRNLPSGGSVIIDERRA